jgi:hypothetical protein
VLLTDLLSEYGCDPGVQPALNLIYLLGGGGGLAGTDEKYHVIGEANAREWLDCNAVALGTRVG